MPQNLIWPDYENCIANIPNSILKEFGVQTVGKTLPIIDDYLQKKYKNVVFLLLDGMGKWIVEKHLDEKGAFRKHLVETTNSVFLSTTVAATTSAMSGLQPCEHAWLGWDCYYPQIDKNVTVFLNKIQNTEQDAASYNVAWTYTPYQSVVEKIKQSGGNSYACTPFLPPFHKSFESIVENIKSLCQKQEADLKPKYIYAYWNQPDGFLHKHGSDSKIVHETLQSLEHSVAKLASEVEDTLIIVTADHGHIDNEYVILQDYPTLCDCLKRLPSLEPRVLNFFVKENKKTFFENEFNKFFGEKFILMPMQEALDKKLFGTGNYHKNFLGMLGDYLAIAISDLTIYYNKERWVSMHGSVTEKEMKIPLIIFECWSK